MSSLAHRHARAAHAVVAPAMAGDELAFSELVSRHRNELRRHAYRILGSHEDSEDVTQEMFLRAWRRRETFRGGSFRGWLYRIATNACLSALERRRRLPTSHGPVVANIRNRPDHVVEGIATTDQEPDAELAAKETLELALLVAIERLPPKQRAVLFLRDVFGWSAKETAALLDTSLASVTSALQRARATLRLSCRSSGPSGLPNGSRPRRSRDSSSVVSPRLRMQTQGWWRRCCWSPCVRRLESPTRTEGRRATGGAPGSAVPVSSHPPDCLSM